MNFNSIITKVTLVFSISILLSIALFFAYYNYEENQLNKQLNDSYIKITRHIHENRLAPIKIEEYLKKLNFQIVKNPETVISNNAPLSGGPGFEIFKYQDSYYLNLHIPEFILLVKDLDKYSLNYYGFLILSIIFIIFVSSFLWIINSLRPLKKLKEEIKEFSNGNLNISCKSNKKDEIAELANEFDNAVKKISLLINSRQLFLRTIMHELKTPIAKGRIVSELLDNEKQKDRMINIFDKLNLQISNFSKIEQIVSQNYSIYKYPLAINILIDKAIDMMMLDNPKNKIVLNNNSNKNINVDLELFSLAIKNLLDNGIKYSTDKKVEIQINNESILIISKGDKLQKPLNEYFKAYHNETRSNNHGMGLGLYIVHEILKMHDMDLVYEYKDDENIFKVLI